MCKHLSRKILEIFSLKVVQILSMSKALAFSSSLADANPFVDHCRAAAVNLLNFPEIDLQRAANVNSCEEIGEGQLPLSIDLPCPSRVCSMVIRGHQHGRNQMKLVQTI